MADEQTLDERIEAVDGELTQAIVAQDMMRARHTEDRRRLRERMSKECAVARKKVNAMEHAIGKLKGQKRRAEIEATAAKQGAQA